MARVPGQNCPGLPYREIRNLEEQCPLNKTILGQVAREARVDLALVLKVGRKVAGPDLGAWVWLVAALLKTADDKPETPGAYFRTLAQRARTDLPQEFYDAAKARLRAAEAPASGGNGIGGHAGPERIGDIINRMEVSRET